MNRPSLLLATIAIVLPHAAAAQDVSDFRLPPSTPTPTPADTDQQGPVAQDVPESRPQPQPAPTTPVRVPTPAPSPARRPPVVLTPAPTAVVQPVPRAAERRQPAPRTTASPTTSASASAASPSPVATATSATVPANGATPAPSIATSAPTVPGAAVPIAPAPVVTSPDDADQGIPAWALWLAGLAAVLVAGFLLVLRHNRRGIPVPRKVLPIERPVIKPPVVVPPVPAAEPQTATTPAVAAEVPLADDTPSTIPAPPAPAADNAALMIALEPLRFGLTLMNATLPYRLILTNRQNSAVHGVRVVADMISAHASLPREQQLSGPPPEAAPAHRIEQIDAGASHEVKGELRLPFPQIVPIRQGNITMMLPLVRFRIETDGGEDVTRLFVVGQAGATPGAGLQPFRLDQGPRNFQQIGQRAFA